MCAGETGTRERKHEPRAAVVPLAVVLAALLAALLLPPDAVAQGPPGEATPRISSAQFRDNPALLDRHPMEVDYCRVVEHWNTGHCYIYSLGAERKVSEYTDPLCTDLYELRNRMRRALEARQCTEPPVPAGKTAAPPARFPAPAPSSTSAPMPAPSSVSVSAKRGFEWLPYVFTGFTLLLLAALYAAAVWVKRGRPALATSSGQLPFSGWVPVLAGVTAGLLLRLIYSGSPGAAFATMMAAFIYLSPMLVGATTVYVAERTRRRTWSYYVWSSLLANVLYVAGAMAIMVEGLICAVIAIPLFCLVGLVGALVTGAICRMTDWPRPAIYSLAVLPLVIGFVEAGVPLPERVEAVERTVLIQAPPERIWREIHNVRDIRRDEVDRAWIYRIGVPLPQAGVTETTPQGRVRKIAMGKDIRFDQVVADWDENRHVRWTHRFAEDSFPPYALDEHVMVGGHYFDFRDTAYTLTPRGTATELRMRMTYRVSTQFNWYAVPVASFLFGNFEEVILDFYRRRSEGSPS